MKKNTIGTRVSHGLLAVALAATLGLVGCSDSSDSAEEETDDTATEETEETEEETEETEETEEETEETEESTEETEEETDTASGTLEGPSDLEIDWETGEFTFTANDENVGYYFVRVYEYTDGEIGDEYVATSSRISGGSTGTLSGEIDLSSLGYETYAFKLLGYAAAGSDDENPDAVTYVYQLGIGAVMECPELMVITDGSEAEFYIDLYTLSDWYVYQVMPTVEFNIYSDADCTELVTTETVDLSTLEPVAASPWITGTNWTTDAEATHLYLEETTGLVSQLVLEDLEAGTYYVTATALGNDIISDSQVSEAVEFTVTDEDPDGEYTATTSSLWQDPVVSTAGAQADEGTYTDRIDFAGTQSTTGELIDQF